MSVKKALEKTIQEERLPRTFQTLRKEEKQRPKIIVLVWLKRPKGKAGLLV